MCIRDRGGVVPFGVDLFSISREVPLVMEESQHEPGPKTIIGDFVIPSGQSGDEDIAMAVEHIFNHPNVGPFVARRLIQQLVKSNPTPRYIETVARVFNDNGEGVRGDLAAVVKTILLDEEARSCDAINNRLHGKLREPVLRNTQVLHALPVISLSGDYWNNAFDFINDTRQGALAAPSVFNFYSPDHQLITNLTDEEFFAPEFKIHNTQSAIGYINQAHKWTQWQIMFWDWRSITPLDCEPEECPDVFSNLSVYTAISEDTESLINHFDVLLAHGRLSDSTKDIIREALDSMNPDWDDYQLRRVQMALYIILISPDYVVLK